ncbi:hypothetical protein FF011L_32920 [Roseimaritima multifibrata]|uniref:Putative zinc-finger domain-containing protein n=1 Tax=Roseimaritima multifibrata TaxID=1930274 RepID=A0A517MI02_9BACT|nr:zf-HC2 domain-containing protein [Roseimaritima multifibrata]QDS94513.1 hypothetical protein FF011L_32920 [Roseimaritima multifibrata]
MVRQDFDGNSDWEDCAPGTITGLMKRLKAERRRKSVVRFGPPVVLTVMLVLVAWNFGGVASSPSLQNPVGEFDFGGVTCSEVQDSMLEFALGELEPVKQDAFTVHFQKCPACRTKLEAMQDSGTPVAASSRVENPADDGESLVVLFAFGTDG